MLKKAEELDEVIINKVQSIDWKIDPNYEQIKRDEIAAERAERRLKNTRIDDLSIDKGLNIARIGKTVFKLLVKETPKIKTIQKEFKEVVRNTYGQKFYTETLQLKPDEIELFLQFCDTDPKSKTLLQNTDVLPLMDFLIKKNIDFKKLQ